LALDSEDFEKLQIGPGPALDVIAKLTEKARTNSDDAEVLKDLATAYTLIGDIPHAISLWETLLTRDPDDYAALLNVSGIYFETGDKDNAFAALTKVIRLSNSHPVEQTAISLAYTNLGIIYYSSAYFEAAVQCFKTALKIYPQNGMANRRLQSLQEVDDPEHGLLRIERRADGQEFVTTWYYKDNVRVDILPHEIVVPACLILSQGSTTEGEIVRALRIPWFEIIRQLEVDPEFLFKIPWRKLEELIAAAYDRAGWPEVILTPRSADKGRDVIACKPGFGAVRIFDQVKAYAPGRVVPANEVRAMLGVLSIHQNVSKAVITTTSSFAKGVFDEFRSFVPYRLELRDGAALKEWLADINLQEGAPLVGESRLLRQIGRAFNAAPPNKRQ